MANDLSEFTSSLYSANNFDAALAALEKEVQRLGFEAVLYTYIPGSLVDSENAAKPHYQVSSDYAPAYLSHYGDARFDRYDPLIKAVSDGVEKPVDWAGDICESYMRQGKKVREVIDVARSYGIKGGITLPLLSGAQGIAGASLITSDDGNFSTLLRENLPQLQVAITMYHNLVLANNVYLGDFIKPMFASLNDLEIRYLAGLATGKSQAAMADELRRSDKYLEQVMLRIRRKVSGVDGLERPTINRNQLFFYAGLVNIVRQAELY